MKVLDRIGRRQSLRYSVHFKYIIPSPLIDDDNIMIPDFQFFRCQRPVEGDCQIVRGFAISGEYSSSNPSNFFGSSTEGDSQFENRNILS
jgi:hypothetical protein